MRRALVPLGALAALLALTGPAVASWAVSAAAGDGGAFATSAVAPASASSMTTLSSVSLTWSAPSGPAPTGYTVQRTGPTAAPVCVNTTATSCTDTGLVPSTTYTYALTSLVGPWTSSPLVVTATTATPSPSAFLVTAPASATAGTSFTVTIQARRSDGSNDTSYTGPHALTFSGPGTVGGNAPLYPASAAFNSSGLATVTVTTYKAEITTLTVADGSPQRTGTSGTITVAALAASVLRWSQDAAGTIDPCPSGRVVVGANGQRSWYVALFDTYGNRAVQGATARTLTIGKTGGGNGNNPTPSSLTVLANANPAVSSGTSTLKLKKKSPTDTTYRATASGLTSISCTLGVT